MSEAVTSLPGIPDQATRLLNGQEIALGAVPYVGLLIAIFGMALLSALLWPDRQRRAANRLRQAPVASFLIGVLMWSLPAIALVALSLLVPFGTPRGQGLLALWLFFTGCAGYAACGRALGERMLPDRGPVGQTMLGTMALVLPLFSLLGLPVLLIAAPLGWGAWVSVGRGSQTPAGPSA